MINDKLGTGLGTDSTQKTAELKFTDYSINKFQSDFTSGKKNIRTRFINSGVKGLLLSQGIKQRKSILISSSGLMVSLTTGP
jgi:hypothetical protein